MNPQNHSSPINQVFLFREQPLGWARQQLNAIRTGQETAFPVWFLYGPADVGKSTLLNKVREEADAQELPTALLDFQQESTKKATRTLLAKEIMEQWERSYEHRLPPGRMILSSDDPEIATEKLLEYANKLHTSARRLPVVLLCDTLEQTSPDTREWLYQKVFLPLLQQGQSFIVLAAREHPDELLPVMDYNLTRRMKLDSLTPFSAEQSEQHLRLLRKNNKGALWIDEVSKEPLLLTSLTGGLPGLNEQVVLYSRENEEDIRLLRRYLVEEVVFKQIALGDPDSFREEILCVAAFRHIHNKTLACIANHFWPYKYPSKTSRTGIILARKLRKTTLAIRHPEGYGLVVVPSLRQLIDDYARDRNLEQHFQTHVEGYRCATEDVNEGDFIAILNRIYHLGGAWQDWETMQSQGKTLSLPYPEDLPKPEDRLGALDTIIQQGIAKLRDQPRAGDLLEKALTLLRREQNDFSRLLGGELTTIQRWFEEAHNRLQESEDNEEGLHDRNQR